jgi:tryptophan-rich sensory protein
MNIFDHPDWTAIAVAAAAALLLAFAGGALTDVGAWYQGLRKPSWQPPNWVFAPVWTTIFVLAAWAAVAAWHLAPDSAARTLLVTLYVINGILNVAWSLLFFRMRRPDWALVEVALLWLSIVALIIAMAGYAPLSSLLLAPYLAWVSVASYLNRTIVRLN